MRKVKKAMRLLYRVLLGSISGCATSVESRLIGQCLELKQPQKIWEGPEDGSVGPILLTSMDRERVFWEKSVIGSLDAGTQVRVARVIRDWNGTWGYFLRVQVEVLEGPFRGLIAEAPSHAPYHPRPPWILESTLDPDALRFSKRFVEDCSR